MNINIGQSEGIKYAGKQNNGQARAIYLNNANSKVNISKNGAITVNTNGNISTKNKQNLIYIGAILPLTLAALSRLPDRTWAIILVH
ncbi:hypothetical protein SDC49_01275 [Lactobacillus sp. R2/2]|nr:hypothetical protein [Lactobacillus sp. R2/2]